MVIFDLDGTLWDAAGVVADSWNIVIERVTGQPSNLTAADISRNMGKTMNEIADILFGDMPEDKRYELVRECEVFENGYLADHGGILYDGVLETLQELKDRGVKMAVVSNGQLGYVKAFLDSMDMWDYFDDYEEWGRTRLTKAGNIRLVLDRNGQEKGVYVGDIQGDADSAHEAGIPCIYAAYGFGDIRDAEARLDSFRELPRVLEEMGYLQ